MILRLISFGILLTSVSFPVPSAVAQDKPVVAEQLLGTWIIQGVDTDVAGESSRTVSIEASGNKGNFGLQTGDDCNFHLIEFSIQNGLIVTADTGIRTSMLCSPTYRPDKWTALATRALLGNMRVSLGKEILIFQNPTNEDEAIIFERKSQ